MAAVSPADWIANSPSAALKGNKRVSSAGAGLESLAEVGGFARQRWSGCGTETSLSSVIEAKSSGFTEYSGRSLAMAMAAMSAS